MTRPFHQAVRVVRRRAPRAPRPHTLSFTGFRLVAIPDRLPAEPPYDVVELSDPSNMMRALAMKPRTPDVH